MDVELAYNKRRMVAVTYLWRSHVDVELPSNKETHSSSEAGVGLQHLSRLLLDDERAVTHIISIKNFKVRKR